jgi:hypothetical protein
MTMKFPRALSAALLATSMMAAPFAAQADDHRDHGGGGHYDHGDHGGNRGDYRGEYRGGGDRDRGGIGVGGVLLGLGLGALVGGAIVQSQQPQYYAPPPQYYAPPPPVYYAPPPPGYYAPPPGAYQPY